MTLEEKLRALIAHWREVAAFEREGGHIANCAEDVERVLDRERVRAGKETAATRELHPHEIEMIGEASAYLRVRASQSWPPLKGLFRRLARELDAALPNEIGAPPPDPLAEDRADWDAAPRW